MGDTVGEVDSGLAVVVIVVSLLGIVGAIAAYVGSGKLYEQVGKGAFSLDREDERDRGGGPAPGSAAARAEAEAEIRQLVEAKSARREARGEPPLDVEAEVAALTATADSRQSTADSSLRDEVRQLVVARNERRIARGEEPLDVEAEVDRQLRDLGG